MHIITRPQEETPLQRATRIAEALVALRAKYPRTTTMSDEDRDILCALVAQLNAHIDETWELPRR